MISPYELDSEQVARMKEWLGPWGTCPWCEASDMGGPIRHLIHDTDCLLAAICEEPRRDG